MASEYLSVSSITKLIVSAVFFVSSTSQGTDLDPGQRQVSLLLQRVALIFQLESLEDRNQQYCNLSRDHFDVEGLGRVIARDKWNSATPTDQQEFLHLFPVTIAATFSKFLEATEAIEFRIVRSSVSNTMIDVRTQVKSFAEGLPAIGLDEFQRLVSGLRDNILNTFSENSAGEITELNFKVQNNLDPMIVDIAAHGISTRGSLVLTYGREGYFRPSDKRELKDLNNHLKKKFSGYCQ